MDMKKILLVLISIILITASVSAISLFTAQDIAKEYLFENEMVDIYSQQTIDCDSNMYFVIPIINSLGELSFFVPVSFKTGDIIINKNNNDNLDLIKTGYVLKALSYSDSGNYLTTQLIDRINTLINILNSRKSRLEGILEGDYPYDVKQEVTTTKNKLVSLTSSLSDLQENLSTLIVKQQEFIYSPSCSEVISLINNFKTSFDGYGELTELSLAYVIAVEDITKAVVADPTMDDSEKRSILDFASVPSSLNSDITLVYNSLSSTVAFYNNIITTSTNTTGEKNLQLFVDNLVSRKDYVIVNTLLEDYDSDFPRYNSLDTVFNTILNPEYKIYWTNQDKVDSLQKNYSELKELYSKGQYTQVIPKVNKAKSYALVILEDGLVEYEDSTSSLAYYLVGGLVLLLIILMFVFRKKKGFKKSNKEDFEKPF